MANQKQLDRLLKGGVQAWNEWRLMKYSNVLIDLRDAPLRDTILTNADLINADLTNADFRDAYLSGANLSDANLTRVNLSGADLTNADLTRANLDLTVFGGVDLSAVKGLKIVNHRGPSTIGIDTIVRSQGKIPEIFLRNAGVPPSIIEAIPSLVGSLSPIITIRASLAIPVRIRHSLSDYTLIYKAKAFVAGLPLTI